MTNSKHLRGCSCGVAAPQRVIDQAREIQERVASGNYRSLDLAALSDADFDRWLANKSAFGAYDGFTISRLPKDKKMKALFG